MDEMDGTGTDPVGGCARRGQGVILLCLEREDGDGKLSWKRLFMQIKAVVGQPTLRNKFFIWEIVTITRKQGSNREKKRTRAASTRMGSKVQIIPNGISLQEFLSGKSSVEDSENMTSADYYADSYGHFGIHGTLYHIISC